MPFDRFEDFAVCRQIDPERLFTQKMFSCLDDVAINLRVQIMRYGAVDSVDIAPLKQFVVIASKEANGRHVRPEPIESLLVRVARRDEDGPDIEVAQVNPTGSRTGELPPHQSEPDNPETDVGRHHYCRVGCRSGFCGCGTGASAPGP